MSTMPGYDAARSSAVVVDRSGEGRLRLTGPDRVAWLQGLVTNDVAALQPGQGCYAAYLTPQGRMISDLRILATREALLLDVPTVARTTVAARFEQFIITEDVVVEDVTARVARLGVHGPAAAAVVGKALDVPAAVLAALAEHAHVDVEFQDAPVVVAGACTSRRARATTSTAPPSASPTSPPACSAPAPATSPPTPGTRCASKPACRSSASTWTPKRSRSKRASRIARSARPRAATSARKSSSGSCTAAAGAWCAASWRGPRTPSRRPTRSCRLPERAIAVEGKDIGRVTSAAWSPMLRRLIGLGYAHRDHTEPGTKLTVGVDPPVAATVAALPLVVMPTEAASSGA